MVVRWLLATALLFSAWSSFAADGRFQGKVIDTPAREQAIPGWIFIQGRNHMLRHVEVAHATIFLGRHGDPRQRRCNLDCLSTGQEILITAEQDPSGEWHAKRVEILWPLVNRSAIRRGAPEATAQQAGPFRLPSGSRQNGSSSRSLDFARDLAFGLSAHRAKIGRAGDPGLPLG